MPIRHAPATTSSPPTRHIGFSPPRSPDKQSTSARQLVAANVYTYPPSYPLRGHQNSETAVYATAKTCLETRTRNPSGRARTPTARHRWAHAHPTLQMLRSSTCTARIHRRRRPWDVSGTGKKYAVRVRVRLPSFCVREFDSVLYTCTQPPCEVHMTCKDSAHQRLRPPAASTVILSA